jgi:Mg2+/Co2+ transporter CorB
MITIDDMTFIRIEDLEAYIINFDDESKRIFRALFNGQSTSRPLTQEEKDKAKYLKRAEALNKMMAEMAVENMARVRSGVWTIDDLVSLTQDTMVKQLISDLTSLSFELAYQKVDLITSPAVTSDIKIQWKTKLASNFFNS